MSDDAATDPGARADGGEDKESHRLATARARVTAAEAAVDAARERLASNRSRPRGAGRVVVGSAALGVIGAIGAAVAAVVLHGQSGAGPADEVVRSASNAVATILTADPARPQAYLDAARAVSGGDYRRRIDAAGPAIESAVASLGGTGTGQVAAAGVVGGSVPTGGPVDVLVVAETTAPQLVGGSVGDRRIVLSVTMIREGDVWVVGQVALR
ncbi:hypothetical protein [uncultured Williamsia sp.]|uniref:hypothetical protein n=1 Tax=uncultured Williamsia sp. TaxID=259311 RepID=UPI002623F043|nr:hypothetical protein [uncultured Williamsia sp.]